MKNYPPLTIPYTETHLLKSANDIEYKIVVSLPPSYRGNENSYPTIFTTDPNFIFPILFGATKSLEKMIPDAIIIGIGHADFDFKELDKKTHNRFRDVDRARDFLPWNLVDWGVNDFVKYFSGLDSELETLMTKYSGNAKDFKNFIETILLPFIDKTYRTNAERTLIGHSFGGVFASWIMLNHQEIFQNYLIISPILDLKNSAMFKEIPNLSNNLKTKAYFCGGALEETPANPNFLVNIKNFQEEIAKSANIISKFEVFEGQNHDSNVPFGISKGLQFIYQK